MKRLILVALASATLAGCNVAELNPAIAEAHKAIREQLRDPDTALFRNDSVDAEYVSGEMNAKNQWGGYRGYRPYSYERKSGITNF